MPLTIQQDFFHYLGRKVHKFDNMPLENSKNTTNT